MEASWKGLEGFLGALGGVLEHLGLILERLGGVLERLGRVLKRLGAENASWKLSGIMSPPGSQLTLALVSLPTSNEEGNLRKDYLQRDYRRPL